MSMQFSRIKDPLSIIMTFDEDMIEAKDLWNPSGGEVPFGYERSYDSDLSRQIQGSNHKILV